MYMPRCHANSYLGLYKYTQAPQRLKPRIKHLQEGKNQIILFEKKETMIYDQTNQNVSRPHFGCAPVERQTTL